MKLLFLYCYPLVGFISLIGFVPQIKTLLTSSSSPVNVSISSWFLWTAASIISFGYGLFVLEDMMFCITTSMSVILNSAVIYLLLKRRFVTHGLCTDFLDVVIEYLFRFPHFGIHPSKLK